MDCTVFKLTANGRRDKRPGKSTSLFIESLQMNISDKPPASCCITHEITHLLPPSRKEERRRKEKKGKERREGERRRKKCSIEAILNNQSVKLF